MSWKRPPGLENAIWNGTTNHELQFAKLPKSRSRVSESGDFDADWDASARTTHHVDMVLRVLNYGFYRACDILSNTTLAKQNNHKRNPTLTPRWIGLRRF